jgi:hypothetical protein
MLLSWEQLVMHLFNTKGKNNKNGTNTYQVHQFVRFAHWDAPYVASTMQALCVNIEKE